MRKILLILSLFIVSLYSEAANVILESKGKATAYTDLTTAVNASVDGDVIYLANDRSYDCSKGLLITHLIQLRGNGTPYINGDITISIDGTPDMKEPVLEGVYVYGDVKVMKAVSNFKLRHCHIDEIQFATPLPNGLIDRCEVSTFNIPPVSENFYVRNTDIYRLKSSSINNNSTTFVNCNIYYIYCENVAGQFINSLISYGYDGDVYSLKNSIMANCSYYYNSLNIDSSTTMINCNSEDPSYNTITSSNYWGRGDDGTPMGIRGGETPFTLTPTVMPKVTYLYARESDGIVNVNVRATSNDKQNN